ncbi:MAG TPA: chlorite dismutase family protein [Acidimicrobiales bacterium]|nr:chlorite dismutase family protein [Acidimicrobiales bacterium]
MSSDPGPVTPSVGWGVLHLFFRVSAGSDAQAVGTAVKGAREAGHQVVTFAVLGHKADIGVMALGPDLWVLRRLQTELVAAGLELVSSYVSMTEVSEYAAGIPEPMRQARLYPNLPPEGMTSICFYPMSKSRDVGRNWFSLPYDERKELMLSHGAVGRQYSGRIVQLITGSTGVDDWEWGVTLFARVPDDLKEVVYNMRFDPASAVYAEFGPFFTGLLGEVDQLLEQLIRP